MQGTAVYRLITPKIFTRIEVATNAKLIQLKQIIEERTQVKPKDQKLYLDQQFKRKINLPDSTTISKLGLKQGDAIYLENSDAKSDFSNEDKNKGVCNQSKGTGHGCRCDHGSRCALRCCRFL